MQDVERTRPYLDMISAIEIVGKKPHSKTPKPSDQEHDPLLFSEQTLTSPIAFPACIAMFNAVTITHFPHYALQFF